MPDNPNPAPSKSRPPVIVNPAEHVLGGGIRGEVAGCPTGLAPDPEIVPAAPAGKTGEGKLAAEPLRGPTEASGG